MPPMMAASATTPTTTPAAMPAVLDDPPLCWDAAGLDVAAVACGSAAAVMVTTAVWPAEISLVTTVGAPEVDDAGLLDEADVADDDDELESDEP